MELAGKIDSIEMKVRELAFKLERLKKENAVLREENKLLKVENDHLKRQVSNTEGDIIANTDQTQRHPDGQHGAPGEGEESEKLRAQIDQYIREIDQCIEWLNNN